MTLTRVCSKKKCKDLREGKQVIAEREDDEPDLSSDENEPEQSDDECVLPPLNSLLQVDVESGKGRNKTTETFFCTVKVIKYYWIYRILSAYINIPYDILIGKLVPNPIRQLHLPINQSICITHTP